MPIYPASCPQHLPGFSPVVQQPGVQHAEGRRRKSMRSSSTLTSFSSQHYDGIPYRHASMIEQLPMELQLSIFTMYLSPYPTISSCYGPLLLSHVCGAWRSAILSTPKFWSSFEIHLLQENSRQPISDHRLLWYMNLWISRSGILPLSIRVTHSPPLGVSHTRFEPFLAALMPQAYRWRSIHFNVPGDTLKYIQQSLTARVPALRSVTLDARFSGSHNSHLDLHSFGILWNQLSILNLNIENFHFSLDDFLEILSQAKNLTSCSALAICRLNTEKYPEKLQLPLLKRFNLILQDDPESSIVEGAAGSLISFLSSLSLPALNALRLEWLVGGDTRWAEIQPKFVTFMGSLATSLRGLSLIFLPLTDKWLLECVSQVPHLKAIQLQFSLSGRTGISISDEVLAALTLSGISEDGGDGAGGLLPELKDIDILCDGRHCSEPLIKALIQSRVVEHPLGVGQYRQLKRFRFTSMKLRIDTLEPYIRKWRHVGLDIDIGTITLR